MEIEEQAPMFNQDLIQLLQEEREREVEAHLRVRRLLGNRRPFVRWRRRQRSQHPGSDPRGR